MKKHSGFSGVKMNPEHPQISPNIYPTIYTIEMVAFRANVGRWPPTAVLGGDAQACFSGQDAASLK